MLNFHHAHKDYFVLSIFAIRFLPLYIVQHFEVSSDVTMPKVSRTKHTLFRNSNFTTHILRNCEGPLINYLSGETRVGSEALQNVIGGGVSQ